MRIVDREIEDDIEKQLTKKVYLVYHHTAENICIHAYISKQEKVKSIIPTIKNINSSDFYFNVVKILKNYQV